MSFRNSRRSIASIHAAAWRRTSRLTSALNSAVSASSSRQRQYSGPLDVPRRRRIVLNVSVPSPISAPPFLLTVTCRTACQFSDAVFLHQFFTQRELISRRSIIHAEHVLARPHVSLRRAVTLQAPIHVERVFAPRQRHPIDPSVAGRAADPLVHMNAVVEINKTRKIM